MFNDEVQLRGDVDLSTSTVTTVSFNDTVEARNNGIQSLTVSTGNAVFTDEVGGGGKSLSSLSVDGTTSLGGDVTTNGSQTYTDAVSSSTAIRCPAEPLI